MATSTCFNHSTNEAELHKPRPSVKYNQIWSARILKKQNRSYAPLYGNLPNAQSHHYIAFIAHASCLVLPRPNTQKLGTATSPLFSSHRRFSASRVFTGAKGTGVYSPSPIGSFAISFPLIALP